MWGGEYRNSKPYNKRNICRNAGKETAKVNRLYHVLWMREVLPGMFREREKDCIPVKI